MISQANGSAVNAYTNNNMGEAKSAKAKPTVISQQGDTSRVEQIKEALNSGEYKIDLQALSEKIADELL